MHRCTLLLLPAIVAGALLTDSPAAGGAPGRPDPEVQAAMARQIVKELAIQETLRSRELPGFWSGLWHGMISPPVWIAGWFSEVTVYADPNGPDYGWGFVYGLCFAVPFWTPILIPLALAALILLLLPAALGLLALRKLCGG